MPGLHFTLKNLEPHALRDQKNSKGFEKARVPARAARTVGKEISLTEHERRRFLSTFDSCSRGIASLSRGRFV
jgi:hypothetical protein